MAVALSVCRLFLAGVFLVAGVAKLRDLPGSRQARRQFGIPDRLATPLGVAGPVAEVVVAVALRVGTWARWGALAALLLLLGRARGSLDLNVAVGAHPTSTIKHSHSLRGDYPR